MSLIKKILKKTAGVGLMIAGLPLSTWGLAIGGGITYGVYIKKYHDEVEQEIQSKTICVLNEKYDNILQELESRTLKFDDNVELKFADTENLSSELKYGQMYDNFIAAFDGGLGGLKISKEEFVNFMLKYGEDVISYVKSDVFKERLSKINSSLQYLVADNKKYFTEQDKQSLFGQLKEVKGCDEKYFEADSDVVKYDKAVWMAGFCMMSTGLILFGLGPFFWFFDGILSCDGKVGFAILKYLCSPFLSLIGFELVSGYEI